MKYELLVLAIAPVVAFVFWIYLKDKYEKEPVWVLVKFFILGIIVSIPAILIEDTLMKVDIWTGYSYYIFLAFVVAALTEEGLKAMILIPTILNEKNFNEKLDGIIYSIFLSLGFATVENIIYILFEKNSMALEVGITRAIVSIPAHMMFAITMGYYISKYKFSSETIKKREYLIMSVLVPILLHGLFDFILMIRYKWSIVMFIIYIVFLWKMNLDKLDYYIGISKFNFLKKKRK
ncbi:MAG: PrsW family glutamic-type intramembrane protease [Romboutsia sp.]